jgi:hypothetical protein
MEKLKIKAFWFNPRGKEQCTPFLFFFFLVARGLYVDHALTKTHAERERTKQRVT